MRWYKSGQIKLNVRKKNFNNFEYIKYYLIADELFSFKEYSQLPMNYINEGYLPLVTESQRIAYYPHTTNRCYIWSGNMITIYPKHFYSISRKPIKYEFDVNNLIIYRCVKGNKEIYPYSLKKLLDFIIDIMEKFKEVYKDDIKILRKCY